MPGRTIPGTFQCRFSIDDCPLKKSPVSGSIVDGELALEHLNRQF
jgi:hypothetical protein